MCTQIDNEYSCGHGGYATVRECAARKTAQCNGNTNAEHKTERVAAICNDCKRIAAQVNVRGVKDWRGKDNPFIKKGKAT